MKSIYQTGPSISSAEWVDLCSRVRVRTDSLQDQAQGTTLAADMKELHVAVTLLCDYVERLHREAGNLMSTLEEAIPGAASMKTSDIQRAAIEISRETHELRPDFKDIMKALFMWQEDPAERVQKKL